MIRGFSGLSHGDKDSWFSQQVSFLHLLLVGTGQLSWWRSTSCKIIKFVHLLDTSKSINGQLLISWISVLIRCQSLAWSFCDSQAAACQKHEVCLQWGLCGGVMFSQELSCGPVGTHVWPDSGIIHFSGHTPFTDVYSGSICSHGDTPLVYLCRNR